MADQTANEALANYIRRIERLNAEKDNLTADIREVYAEAKAMGFDKTVMGQVVQARKKRAKDEAAFAEQSELFSIYWDAVENEGQEQPRTRTRVREEQDSGGSPRAAEAGGDGAIATALPATPDTGQEPVKSPDGSDESSGGDALHERFTSPETSPAAAPTAAGAFRETEQDSSAPTAAKAGGGAPKPSTPPPAALSPAQARIKEGYDAYWAGKPCPYVASNHADQWRQGYQQAEAEDQRAGAA